MKCKLKNKQLLVIIVIFCVLLCGLLIGVLFWGNSKTGDSPVEYLKRQVYSSKAGNLGDPNNDIGVRITDCDSTEAFKEVQNLKVTTRAGHYIQGTGAFVNMKFQTELARGVLRKSVDISEYENGSVHISIYVADKSALTDMLHFELSSMAAPDVDELEWFIPLSKVEEGWNEFYLSIPNATKSGKIDLKAVNFFRLFSPNPKMGVKVVLDDIYATKTEGVVFAPESSALKEIIPDAYKETESEYGKMIMSCNTVNIFSALGNVEVTTAANEHVEGTGAFKTVGFQDSLGEGVFAKPIDLTEYKDGNIHISFYVNDVSCLNKEVYFELTSAGNYDADEYNWCIQATSLQNGWNELYLPFSAASVTGSPNLQSIDYFRFFTIGQKEQLVTIFDNVYATNQGAKDSAVETEAKYGKMIISGNTVNIFRTLSNMEVTNKTGEYIEGTGALKTVGFQPSLGEGAFEKEIDISAYKDGYVHISLYVNDVSRINKEMFFEITSSGTYDADEYNWCISVTALKNGWNELSLPFSEASVTGTPNLKAINYFRFFTLEQKEGLVTIFDNIYATEKERDTGVETSSEYGKMIMSCNTKNIFKVLMNAELTTKESEYIEGTGAFKTVGLQPSLGEGVFEEAVNVSSYKNGYVHISLYINDISYINKEVYFELSSAGVCDADEYNWCIPVALLKNGWNDLYLAFSNSSVTGTPNLKAINYFRFFTLEQKEGLVTIFDNVYATNSKDRGVQIECSESLKDGDIMSSNCTCYYSKYSNIQLTQKCKEGMYALKTKKSGEGMSGVFKAAVDISHYKKGYVHIWLYINDVKQLKSNVNFELSSSGGCDKNEYAWAITKELLNSGWNELYLPLQQAIVTGKPDLSGINYFRMYASDSTSKLELILDDVYATNSNGGRND